MPDWAMMRSLDLESRALPPHFLHVVLSFDKGSQIKSELFTFPTYDF